MLLSRERPVNAIGDRRARRVMRAGQRAIWGATLHFTGLMVCAVAAWQLTADWRPHGVSIGVIGIVMMLYGGLAEGQRDDQPATVRRAVGVHYAAVAVAGIAVLGYGLWLFALDYASAR